MRESWELLFSGKKAAIMHLVKLPPRNKHSTQQQMTAFIMRYDFPVNTELPLKNV